MCLSNGYFRSVLVTSFAHSFQNNTSCQRRKPGCKYVFHLVKMNWELCKVYYSWCWSFCPLFIRRKSPGSNASLDYVKTNSHQVPLNHFQHCCPPNFVCRNNPHTIHNWTECQGSRRPRDRQRSPRPWWKSRPKNRQKWIRNTY